MAPPVLVAGIRAMAVPIACSADEAVDIGPYTHLSEPDIRFDFRAGGNYGRDDEAEGL